jgi:hypothetical protein
VNGERQRAVQVPSIAVLDDLLELVPQRGGELERLGRSLDRCPHERPDRFGTIPEFVVALVPVEERLLLGGESNSEKVGRGSTGSSGPHAYNRI